MDPRRYVTEEVKIEKEDVAKRARLAREQRDKDKKTGSAALKI
jgi:hypothetical protein